VEQIVTKTIGVLGGMGPEATLDFFAKVLAHERAERDQEHLRLLIDNNPAVPNRNEAVAGTGPSPAPVLAEMARGLERAGAEFLVMACNAAHAFQREVEAAVAIPFLSIIEVTAEAALERVPGVRAVGVLGSSGCLDAGLYQTAFSRRGVTAPVPEGEARARFMTLLYRIKGGDKGEAVRRGMLELADGLAQAGAEAIVAGCTEVPLVLGENDLTLPLLDSSDALAAAAVACARGERPLPERAT
jgi:aspartate racemase